jgi:hypothetical protein
VNVPAARRLAAAGAALLLASVEARAQEPDDSSDVATQIWANVTLGRSWGKHRHLELDLEPKVQVSGSEQWRNLDVTPLIEFYPSPWIDLEGEVALGRTHQREGLDTFEVTPRAGLRLHLFEQVAAHGPQLERLPLSRFGVSTLFRVEFRNFFYSDDTPEAHEWRARVRLEGKVALNRQKLSEDGTLHATADAEYYAPLTDDVAERFVNKLRVRLGLGFRFSAATRLDALYIRDWNRTEPGTAKSPGIQAFDVRVGLRF